LRIQVLKVFRSRSLNRTLQKGEIVDSSPGWCKKIEEAGLGVILDEKPKRTYKRKTKVINKQEVETTAVEPPND
jgi:hypothetical protein